MKNPIEGQDGIVIFESTNFQKKRSNEILRKRNGRLWWGIWIVHLVHVDIIMPHWVGVIEKPLWRWYALHPGGRVLLKRKALGLYWYLNPAIFSTTHNLAFLIYASLKIKLVVKDYPNLHSSLSWEEPRYIFLTWLGRWTDKKWQAHWHNLPVVREPSVNP